MPHSLQKKKKKNQKKTNFLINPINNLERVHIKKKFKSKKLVLSKGSIPP